MFNATTKRDLRQIILNLTQTVKNISKIKKLVNREIIKNLKKFIKVMKKLGEIAKEEAINFLDDMLYMILGDKLYEDYEEDLEPEPYEDYFKSYFNSQQKSNQSDKVVYLTDFINYEDEMEERC